jgi:hypothetical protein
MIARILIALSLCAGGLTAAETHKKPADPKAKTEHAKAVEKPAEKAADKPKPDSRDAETDLAKAFFKAQEDMVAAGREARRAGKTSWSQDEAANDPAAIKLSDAVKKVTQAQRDAIVDFFKDDRRRVIINPATTDAEKDFNGYVAQYPWTNDQKTMQKTARAYAKIHGLDWLAELVDGKR